MNTMKIHGKYETGDNFTHIYCNNTIYVLTKNGEWSCIKVGQMTAMGGILDQETYNKWETDCKEEGTFTLEV